MQSFVERGLLNITSFKIFEPLSTHRVSHLNFFTNAASRGDKGRSELPGISVYCRWQNSASNYYSKLKNIWMDTMNKEDEELERSNPWTPEDLPPVGEKASDSEWVSLWKSDGHGYVIDPKARLLFRGNKQEMDDTPVFSTTPRQAERLRQ